MEMNRDHKAISIWLMAGVVMVFFQIMLGGITRLTESGLSITTWDVVSGVLPPLNAAQWEESFNLYKQSPQYQQVTKGITISEFKFIFFWEYVHRLWARSMGFVFLIPFLFFYFRKSIYPALMKRLGIVILLASLAAIFGWIMVASGLIERPWVNAYKLTIHLGLGIALFIYLFMTWLIHTGYRSVPVISPISRNLTFIIILVMVQIAIGGFVSGMKASLNYPTWPLMHGAYLPSILLDASQWNMNNFLFYDRTGFMPALVQFIHRNLAYLLLIIVILFSIRWLRNVQPSRGWVGWVLIGIIVVQASLGILTLIYSIGEIPVLYGTLHQSVGILFLTFLIYIDKVSISGSEVNKT